MGFRQDAYAKVWKVEDKGKYHNVQLTTSKKDKETGEYNTDFSGFVRFVGTAHQQAETLQDGDRIKLGACDVTNSYNKEKKITYTNYAVFSYSSGEDNTPKQNTKINDETDADDDAMPF